MATITETQTTTPENEKPKSIQPPVPYHVPTLIGAEADNVHSASFNAGLAGGGEFTNRITEWLEKDTEQSRTFLTNSCIRALEMAALLCGPRPGDEMIAPSYTFVSTINAFLLRGARVVFIDIDKYSMNLGHDLIEGAITDRTRVIIPVHYAAVGCDMDAITDIAQRHNLLVVEDAAQCQIGKAHV